MKQQLKNKIMKKLTQKEVKEFNKETLLNMLNEYQNMACNVDYIKDQLKSDIIQHNINMVESRLIYKEF